MWELGFIRPSQISTRGGPRMFRPIRKFKRASGIGSLRRPRRRFNPNMGESASSLELRALLATVNVDVINFAFNPDPVTINVGDTVHWVWQTDRHSTTSVAGSAVSWDSGVHNTGFTFD